jgi:crotonobetainyl-CoA:carnitine CoA-transferase CaiB-like acyl-CoA transferase
VLPLHGVRVLDLSRLLPGPYATLVLADLGADVVKVEDPRRGDYLRSLAPFAGTQSGAFHALNRSKRSLALDLKVEGGAGVLLRLARSFDVLVESFRPGVLDRVGAGHGALRASSRPRGCSITGYGQTGPYRELAGHDLNYAAIAGALGVNGPEEAPLPFGVQAADVGGAWVAVAGILAALYRRASTGEGAVVDVSIAEAALGMMTMQLGMAAARGSPLQRGREVLSGAAACYRVYRTLDGGSWRCAIEPASSRFCEAVGRRARGANTRRPGPAARLEELFATRTRRLGIGREQDLCSRRCWRVTSRADRSSSRGSARWSPRGQGDPAFATPARRRPRRLVRAAGSASTRRCFQVRVQKERSPSCAPRRRGVRAVAGGWGGDRPRLTGRRSASSPTVRPAGLAGVLLVLASTARRLSLWTAPASPAPPRVAGGSVARRGAHPPRGPARRGARNRPSRARRSAPSPASPAA